MTVDPMDALNGFEQALNAKKIKAQPCEIDGSINVHLDYPDGSTPRFTYGPTKRAGNSALAKTKVRAVAVLVGDEPYNGLGCFQISYATSEDERNQGLAKRVVGTALIELYRGMARNGVKRFYVEAVIDEDNIASQRVADAFLVGAKEWRHDDFGNKVVRYMKLLD